MMKKFRAYFHFIKRQQKHKEAFGVHPIRAVLIETTEEPRARKLMDLAQHPAVIGGGTRPKFNFNPAIIDLWMDMAATGVVVSPSSIVTVSPDEADNRFLECAEAAKADFLVTGNSRDFPKRWKQSKIVNARSLLDLLGMP